VRRGDAGARYGIGARLLLEPDQWYRLCGDGGRRVCQRLREAAAGRPKSSRRTASP
jgi:hypothetical protein